jgi:hypothetical protein
VLFVFEASAIGCGRRAGGAAGFGFDGGPANEVGQSFEGVLAVEQLAAMAAGVDDEDAVIGEG